MRIEETTLTLSKGFETFSATFKNIDVSLEQLFTAFRGLLVANGWQEETINQFIVELADELCMLTSIDIPLEGQNDIN